MDAPTPNPVTPARWISQLTKGRPGLPEILGFVPAAPRCKLCSAPFRGVGRHLSFLIGRSAWSSDSLVCRHCRSSLLAEPGGLVLDISVLAVDVRRRDLEAGGSPGNGLLNSFACRIIDRHGGLIDRFLPAGLLAVFLPRRAGAGHAENAISAIRDLFAAAMSGGLGEVGFQLAAGLASGRTFVGAVGTSDDVDLTAVGEAVDIAIGLGAAATGGEALVSLGSWRRHNGPYAKSRLRTVPIPGKLHPIEAVLIRGDIEATI